jgi:hypothetical protein
MSRSKNKYEKMRHFEHIRLENTVIGRADYPAKIRIRIRQQIICTAKLFSIRLDGHAQYSHFLQLKRVYKT